MLDDLDFLNFIKQTLEERINRQEALIVAEKIGFYDKKLNYELSKELHTYQKWLNDVNSYIINKTVFGGNNTMKKEDLLKYNQSLLEENKKLLESNKMLSKKIEELKIEIDFLNREIMQLLDENNL